MVPEQTHIALTRISMEGVVGNKYKNISNFKMQYPLAEIKKKKHVSGAKFAHMIGLSATPRDRVTEHCAYLCWPCFSNIP